MSIRLVLLKPFCVLVCLLVLALPISVAQAADPWISLAAGSTFELLADTDQLTLRVPVTLLPGIAADQVSLKLVDASIGQRHDTRLMDGFNLLPMALPAAGRGTAIEIQVNLTRLPGQGVYSLTIEASTPSQKDVQSVRLQVIHPPAKLSAPATVVVENTLLAITQPGISAAPLALRETGGKSRLTGLQFTPTGFFTPAGLPVSGNVVFFPLQDALVPGGVLSPAFSLQGNFPLGASKGSIEISAPQLETPVVVKYEVQTRYAAWLIPLVILLGLATGYLGRTGLDFQIRLGEARLKGYDLLRSIQSSRQAHPDAEFQAVLNKLDVALRADLKGSDPLALTNAINTARGKLEKALNELGARRADCQKRLEELLALVQPQWLLPAEISASLPPARQAAEKAQALLREDRIQEAQALLDQTSQKINQDLPTQLSSWRAGLELRLSELSQPDVALPSNVAGSLNRAVEPLRQWLNAIDTSTLLRAESLAPAATVFEQVYNIRINSLEMLVGLRHWLRSTLEAAALDLRKAGVPEEEVAALEQKILAFTNALAAQEEPDLALQLLEKTRLQDIDQAWSALLYRHAPQGVAGQSKNFKKLVLSRQYSEAARLLFLLKEQARMAEEGTPLGEESPQTSAAGQPGAAPFWFWAPRLARPVSRGSVSTASAQETIPAELDSARAHTLRQIAASKFWRSLIAGAGILVVGYLLFSTRFIGTFQDFAAIFLWAFGLDVSIDAFLQIAKGAAGARSS